MWGPNCPKCGKGPTDWLATTNEWRWYCKPCDIRFNDRLEQPQGDNMANLSKTTHTA